MKDLATDGSVDGPPGSPDAALIDGPPIDGPLVPQVAVTPAAPTVEHPMYQGTQTRFKSQLGTTCTGRVAASMGGKGFCYLAASDDVKCSGEVGDVSYGMGFSATGQTNATQLMVMFNDNGMCITKTDHTVVCMTDNTNAFGNMTSPASFTRWTAHADVEAIATGTWDQICGITTGGQVFCGGLGSPNFGNPPINLAGSDHTSLWVNTSGMALLDDTTVLRPAESRTSCQVKANGLACNGTMFGPTNGTVVMGSKVQTVADTDACWLTDDGTVTCSFGPRFAPGKVLFLATDVFTDSLCAIYSDGAVWCIGSNSNGKLGTGNTAPLTTETMVAPPGSARVSCE